MRGCKGIRNRTESVSLSALTKMAVAQICYLPFHLLYRILPDRVRVTAIRHHKAASTGSFTAAFELCLLVSELLERHIQDRILAPIVVIEVPPFFGIDREAFAFHRGAQ